MKRNSFKKYGVDELFEVEIRSTWWFQGVGMAVSDWAPHVDGLR